MIRDGNDKENIYKINIKEHLDSRKIMILVLMIVVLIGLIMVAEKSMEIIKQHKVYEQYEAQQIALKKQEEDRKAKIEREQERIRQEKIPKLTQKRKRQYGEYLSFRNEESFFNF